MMHKVELTFFEDDTTGIFGVAPKDSIERSFNAFWDGIGIFHDVFEHYFEGKHKYFLGEFSYNIGGEVCAMGAALYYYYILGVRNRNRGGASNFLASAIDTTFGEMSDSIYHEGGTHFGRSLECSIPRIKKLYEYPIADVSEEHMDKFKSGAIIPEGVAYFRSITKEKLTRLYTFGYKMARKLIPDNNVNRQVLSNFIGFWDSFCKRNSAEELQYFYKSITFRVYKVKGEIKWTARLDPRDYTVPSMSLNEDSIWFSIEDVYSKLRVDEK